MTTVNAISSNKAARGAKHTCQECEVRFYDLLRNPIVCPSCGAVHIPAVQPAMDAGRRAAPAGKTGWRQSGKRPSPVLPPEAVPEDAVRPEAAAADDLEVGTDEVADAAPEDDIVLDPEADEADVSDLVEHDVEEPKEG
jgi:hypothetical protein